MKRNPPAGFQALQTSLELRFLTPSQATSPSLRQALNSAVAYASGYQDPAFFARIYVAGRQRLTDYDGLKKEIAEIDAFSACRKVGVQLVVVDRDAFLDELEYFGQKYGSLLLQFRHVIDFLIELQPSKEQLDQVVNGLDAVFENGAVGYQDRQKILQNLQQLCGSHLETDKIPEHQHLVMQYFDVAQLSFTDAVQKINQKITAMKHKEAQI